MRGVWVFVVVSCGSNANGPASHCIDASGVACPVLASGVYAQRLALDSTTLYWTHVTPGGIAAIAKNGGSVRDVVTTETPTSIAVDESGLFFGVSGSESAGYADGLVDTVDKGGGPVSLLGTVGQDPMWLALGATDVYASTQIANPENPGIVSPGLFGVSRVGGTVNTLAGLAGPVAADVSGVYWAAAFAPNAEVWSVAVDATNIYFAAFADVQGSALVANVAVVPKAGGATTVLFTGDYVRSIAVDATDIYALQMGDADSATGRIVRIPKSGGTATIFASQLSYPTDLVLDESYVYCADFDAATIVKLAK